MKVTLEIPTLSALALRALIEKARRNDPAADRLKAELALHGITLQGIKLIK